MPLFINGPARHSSTKRSFRVAGVFASRPEPAPLQRNRHWLLGHSLESTNDIIRIPVLYLHPGFHAFQAILTAQFLQIFLTFRMPCMSSPSLPQTILNQRFTAMPPLNIAGRPRSGVTVSCFAAS
jgi:hypothetical protein